MTLLIDDCFIQGDPKGRLQTLQVGLSEHDERVINRKLCQGTWPVTARERCLQVYWTAESEIILV